MIEFVGWADEKGEGQQRANEMRGVFVRGRMQQFRVNSEQRMLVLTDSQQEGADQVIMSKLSTGQDNSGPRECKIHDFWTD